MPRFDIGVVFDRFFKLIGENVLLFAVLGLIGTVGPALVAGLALLGLIGRTSIWSESFSRPLTSTIAIIAVTGVLVVFINMMTQSIIAEVAILRAVGKPVRAGQLISNAVRNAVPIFVILVLVVVFIALGTVALVIPGIFLAICLCVAIPAYVGQPGLGVWGAIMKSFELTRGNRWWLLLIGVVAWIVSAVIQRTFGAMLVGLVLNDHLRYGLILQIVLALAGGIRNLILHVLAAATYVTLRQTKEPLAPDQTADIFG